MNSRPEATNGMQVRQPRNRRVPACCSLFLAILLGATSAPAQKHNLRIEYTVRVASIEKQLLHVTANISNIRQRRLALSLPVWTPGWYTVENYGKNILHFKITNAQGEVLGFTKTRKQTWTVETFGRNRIQVDFDYKADVLAVNQAKITKDFAFFTGTQIFLMPEGHRTNYSTVRFECPAEWRVVSALDETSEPNVYFASDYDALVDAPTVLGRIDITNFEIEGKPHELVSIPAGGFSEDNALKFKGLLTKIATAQSAIFKGLPYKKFVYFYLRSPAESNANGALEHANSYVTFAAATDFSNPEGMIEDAAHEFFHVWNGKRLRPTELWPYDYSQEKETPLLWFTEGFTEYYAHATLYRAGLRSRAQFLASVANAIGRIESSEARSYISPTDSSVSTWLCYDKPCASSISYYAQGQTLAALMDLSILHDTNGRASLDDVLRTLYGLHIRKGQGFSTEQLIYQIRLLTRHDYHDFFRRYVSGVEVPSYDEVFGYAGYRLDKNLRKIPVFDIEVSRTPKGLLVTNIASGSPFGESGLRVGDLLLGIDEIDLTQGSGLYKKLTEKIGQTVKLTVNSMNETKLLDMQVKSRDLVGYVLVDLPRLTGNQQHLRERWQGVGQR